MSFAPYTPNPNREECLAQAGLPSWFDGNPMNATPQVMLDPASVQAYYACLQSKIGSQQNPSMQTPSMQTPSPINQTRSETGNTANWVSNNKGLVVILGVVAVLGFMKYKKMI